MLKSIFKIFFGAKRTRPFFVLTCLVLAGLAELISMSVLLPATSQIGGGTTENSSSLNALVENTLTQIGITPNLTNMIFIFCGMFALKAIFAFAAMAYVAHTVAFVATDMRSSLLKRLLDARWDFFTDQRVGFIANSISNDATRAGDAYANSANTIAFIVQAGVYVIVAILISSELAIVGVLVGAILAVSLRSLVKMSRKHGYRQTDRTAELVTYVSDALSNIKPLKSMERQASFIELFKKKIGAIRRALFRQKLAVHGRKHGEEILVAFFLGVGVYGAAVVGNMPLPEMVVMGIVFFQMVALVGKAQLKLQNAVQFESSWWRLTELIEVSENAAEQNPGTRQPSFNIGAKLVDIDFSHREKKLIKNASLNIPAGKITVLQGASGAGKTTLIDLVIGLYQPSSGKVLIDDVNLNKIDLKLWRRMLGYVPQELTLFHGTIRENITLGDAKITQHDIDQACQRAGVSDFLDDIENGLETVAGEMGAKLSGGQRQRIALARALVTRPSVLILDEVTSALDPRTEAGIVDNIKALAGEFTIIAITHRPVWTKAADYLYEVEDGKVREIKRARAPRRKKARA